MWNQGDVPATEKWLLLEYGYRDPGSILSFDSTSLLCEGFFFLSSDIWGEKKIQQKTQNPAGFKIVWTACQSLVHIHRCQAKKLTLEAFVGNNQHFNFVFSLLLDSYEKIVKNNKTSIHRDWLCPPLPEPYPAHASAGKGQPENSKNLFLLSLIFPMSEVKSTSEMKAG